MRSMAELPGVIKPKMTVFQKKVCFLNLTSYVVDGEYRWEYPHARPVVRIKWHARWPQMVSFVSDIWARSTSVSTSWTSSSFHVYQLMRLDETNRLAAISCLYLNLIESYCQKFFCWPQMIFWGVSRKKCWWLSRAASFIMTSLYQTFAIDIVKMRNISIFFHWVIIMRSQKWNYLRSQTSKSWVIPVLDVGVSFIWVYLLYIDTICEF